jgi:hypothetical protein
MAYQRVVESAVGKEGLRNHDALAAICSNGVQASLRSNAEAGVWSGWNEMEPGSHLEVHDVHVEIARASIVFETQETDYKDCTDALFDVRYLTYETLVTAQGERTGPEMKAVTWRFQGQMLRPEGDEMVPNPDLVWAVIGIEGLDDFGPDDPFQPKPSEERDDRGKGDTFHH